jgi:hypothetical protein
MIKLSKPDLDSIDLSTLTTDLNLMTSPSNSDTQLFSVQTQASYFDVNTALEPTQVRLPTPTPSSLTVDAALAPALTPSRSSLSRDASESILDSPPQAIARAPPRFFCDKTDCSKTFALQQQLK